MGLHAFAQVCRWAALAHAAARVAGLTCTNDLGAFTEELMIDSESAPTTITTASRLKNRESALNFCARGVHQLCE